jgi:hypothetical protein
MFSVSDKCHSIPLIYTYTRIAHILEGTGCRSIRDAIGTHILLKFMQECHLAVYGGYMP